MIIEKGNYGECRFVDNMDKAVGVPSLAPKAYQLGFTDPPYNIKYKKPSGLGVKPADKNKYKVTYKDDMTRDEYAVWCDRWFHYTREATDCLVFSPGRMNLDIWYKIAPPKDYFIWYKRNAQGGASASHLARDEPFLVYGKIPNKMTESVLDIYVINGFLCEEKYIHPVPKSINLWREILEQINPSSVLDVFLGSGTTAQVCEEMGIPWLGYEILEAYHPDIQYRIAQGIKDHKSYTARRAAKEAFKAYNKGEKDTSKQTDIMGYFK